MNLSNHSKKIAAGLSVVLFVGVAVVIVSQFKDTDIKDCDTDTMRRINTDSEIDITTGKCFIEEALYQPNKGNKCRVSDLIGKPLYMEIPNLDGDVDYDHNHLCRDEDSPKDNLSHKNLMSPGHTCIRLIRGRWRRGHQYCPPH